MVDLGAVRSSLTEITRTFYQSKLAVAAPAVEVMAQEDIILVRVRGFITAAEQRLVGKAGDRRMLEEYYLRLADMIHPLLEQVIAKGLGHPPVGRRTVIDLERSECLYLLTLGVERPSGLPHRVGVGGAAGWESEGQALEPGGGAREAEGGRGE